MGQRELWGKPRNCVGGKDIDKGKKKKDIDKGKRIPRIERFCRRQE